MTRQSSSTCTRDLRVRWNTEANLFRATLLLDSAVVDSVNGTFAAANQQAIEAINTAPAMEWRVRTNPAMFRSLLDVKGLFAGTVPACEPRVQGEALLDLRGYPFAGDAGEHYRGIYISGADLSWSGPEEGLNLWFSILKDCVWEGATWKALKSPYYWNRCQVRNVDFDRAKFGRVFMNESTFENCRFTNQAMHSVSANNCVFAGCNFRGVCFGTGAYYDTLFERCSFRKADMELPEYRNCRFVDCDFRDIKYGFVPPSIDS